MKGLVAGLFVLSFFLSGVSSAFAASGSSSINVSTSVVENISVSGGEGSISGESGALNIKSGSDDKQTSVPYTATMDTSNFAERSKYDSFTEQYNQQFHKEDITIKRQCNSIKGKPSQTTDPAKVTITW